MYFSNVVRNKTWIAEIMLCVGIIGLNHHVFATPQINDKNETPFPLELQPPLVDNLQDAIDSYGNPITYSQPIETPDGRKVISAQGVQFEIPNYASGITEIKKPIESLLPPFVELSTKPSSKLTFTKNDQGKVISRNVFEPGQYSTNPVLTPPSKNDFGSSTLTPDFSTQLTTPIANVAGKYTGGFGGAPGILVGQSKPALNLHSEITTPRAITTPIPKKVFTGSFGGPPGILTPYDNV